jgi:NADH-ubiquinone oxidoreductase chain 5
MGSDFFQNSIFMHPKNISLIEAEFSLLCTPPAQPSYSCSFNNIFIKLLPAILSFTGALSSIIFYHLPFGLFKINWGSCIFSCSSSLPFPPFGGKLGWGAKQTTTRMGGSTTTTSQSWKVSSYNKIGKNIYAFLNGKYFFDVIYNHFIIQSGFKLGYNISKEIDRGAIELLGPYGLSNYFYNAGKNLAKLDTGVITTYSLYITIALISLLFILFSPSLSSYGYDGAAVLVSGALPSQSLANNLPANPQSLEEIRLFIIYIISALFVMQSTGSASSA